MKTSITCSRVRSLGTLQSLRWYRQFRGWWACKPLAPHSVEKVQACKDNRCSLIDTELCGNYNDDCWENKTYRALFKWLTAASAEFMLALSAFEMQTASSGQEEAKFAFWTVWKGQGERYNQAKFQKDTLNQLCFTYFVPAEELLQPWVLVLGAVELLPLFELLTWDSFMLWSPLDNKHPDQQPPSIWDYKHQHNAGAQQ